MKTLKNLLLGAAVLCFFTITAKAQTTQTHSDNPWHFGVGVESGITLSGIASKTEIGATGRLQYDVSKNFALTLTSGYYEFLGTNVRAAMGLVPVKLGLKAYAGSGFSAERLAQDLRLKISTFLKTQTMVSQKERSCCGQAVLDMLLNHGISHFGMRAFSEIIKAIMSTTISTPILAW